MDIIFIFFVFILPFVLLPIGFLGWLGYELFWRVLDKTVSDYKPPKQN